MDAIVEVHVYIVCFVSTLVLYLVYTSVELSVHCIHQWSYLMLYTSVHIAGYSSRVFLSGVFSIPIPQLV